MLPIFRIKNSIINSKLVTEEQSDLCIGYAEAENEPIVIYSTDEGNSEDVIREKIIEYCSGLYKKLFPKKELVVTHSSQIKIELEKPFYLWETDLYITILQDNFYYINKRMLQFMQPTYYSQIRILKKQPKCFQYNKGPQRLDALFMRNHDLLSYNDFIRQFKILGIEEEKIILYIQWYHSQYIDVKQLNVYRKALIIEEKLSEEKIWLDLNVLETFPESFQEQINNAKTKDYIIQKQQGSDKTTGRIFVKDSDISIQTLSKNLLKIIKPKDYNCFLLDIDYNFFEFNIMCNLCDIKFEGDPHLYLAELIFNDKNKRQEAKAINYAIIYGGNIEYILAKNNSADKKIILEELYLNKIRIFETQLQEEYAQNGFIVNLFNRRIYPKKETALLNNYISSTATDFLITKLYKLYNLLHDYESTIVFQKHDSILFNILKKERELVTMIKEIMMSEEKGIINTIDCNEYFKNYLVE